MNAMQARARRLVVSSVAATAALGLACKAAPRAPSRTPAGTTVTVYAPLKTADRLMGRLQAVAARNQWALSVRTDSGALGEADLVITDSGGTLRGRVRPDSPVAAQARVMADAVLP
jgi:hypothetical protein